MSIDVTRARAETPGCARVVHFDHAGASLPAQRTLDAVAAQARREAEVGGYRAADDAADTIEATYDSMARLLNASPDEVAFAGSATHAWATAWNALDLRAGDRVLVSRVEYASNVLAVLQARRERGVELEVIPSTATGEVDTDALAAMIDGRVRLVCVTHCPTEGGLVNPAAAVGEVARAAGVRYLLDACQSVGQLPIDVREIGCDLLTGTGRKFLRAPRGTGFLFVRSELLDRLEPHPPDHLGAPWVAADRYEPRPDARRFEYFERSFANQLGLGAAIDHAIELGLHEIRDRVDATATKLRERLAALPGVTVRDEGTVRSGIVTFDVAGEAPDALVARARSLDVNLAVSRQPMARFDLAPRGITELVRASVHYLTTDDEIDRLVSLVGRG